MKREEKKEKKLGERGKEWGENSEKEKMGNEWEEEERISKRKIKGSPHPQATVYRVCGRVVAMADGGRNIIIISIRGALL